MSKFITAIVVLFCTFFLAKIAGDQFDGWSDVACGFVSLVCAGGVWTYLSLDK